MCCFAGNSCTNRWRGSHKVVSVRWTAIATRNHREAPAAVLASRAIQVGPVHVTFTFRMYFSFFFFNIPFFSVPFYYYFFLFFFRSTGFILEGFPQYPEEVSFLVEHHLYPDTALVMSVDVSEVVKRLVPPRLDRWRERCTRRRGQIQLLKELRSKIRVRGKKRKRAANHAFIVKKWWHKYHKSFVEDIKDSH